MSEASLLSLPPLADQSDPLAWLRDTPLLDLKDPRLRLKAQSLTQLCKNPREKALAIYGFVKRIEATRRIKMRFRTAREVIDAGEGDADDKATVLMALLRAAGLPARLCYVELRGDILRGLLADNIRAARPVAEVWVGGRWLRTDTYIYDAAYIAAARQRLRDTGETRGWGIHVDAPSLWTGMDDAFLGALPTEQDPMVLRVLPLVSDPQELLDLPEWRREYPRMKRALHWNVLAPGIDRVLRQLREEARQGVELPRRD